MATQLTYSGTDVKRWIQSIEIGHFLVVPTRDPLVRSDKELPLPFTPSFDQLINEEKKSKDLEDEVNKGRNAVIAALKKFEKKIMKAQKQKYYENKYRERVEEKSEINAANHMLRGLNRAEDPQLNDQLQGAVMEVRKRKAEEQSVSISQPTYIQPTYIQPTYIQPIYVQPTYGDSRPRYSQPIVDLKYSQP